MTESTTDLASEHDVTRMRVAARGLSARQVKNTLGGAGIPASRGLRSVASRHVHWACRMLEIAVRGDIRSPVAPYIAGRTSLEHEDCLDGWPLADEADLRRLRQAADALFPDQVGIALHEAGADPGAGLAGVARSEVEAVCVSLRSQSRLGKAA